MGPPRRLLWTLVFAAFAHLAAMNLVSRLEPTQSALLRSEPAIPAALTDIDLESAPPDHQETPASPPSPLAAQEPSAALDSRVAALSRNRPQPADPPAAHALLAERNADTWTLSPATSSSAHGIGPLVGDRRGDAVLAGIAMTVAQSEKVEEAARAPEAIIPRHDAKDMALGLAPGGELVTLAREATHRSLVPTTSNAVLEFETDDAGMVVNGRVLDASSGSKEWGELAAELITLARDKRLHVPAGTRGLVVTVMVRSALKNVGGGEETGKTGVVETMRSVTGAIMDPLGTIASRSVPALRMVSANIVAVHAR